MKINIGIVGYGNLGKSCERSVLSNARFNLVAIFSRRTVTSKFNTVIEPYENCVNYVGKIDIMLLCGGSKSDLEIQTPSVLSLFDCINTFDTHSKILSEYNRLDVLAKNSNHRLIMSCGWDPGIFSVVRAMFEAVSYEKPVTFWGKGISLGHSDAIRRVPGVIDGVQFTVPSKVAMMMAGHGKQVQENNLHTRECYVVAKESDQKQVEEDIKNIPNYFLGQKTNVHFVSNETVSRLKQKLSHKGEVISVYKTIHGSKCKMNFSVSMESNPDFTACIMMAYINAILNLKEKNASGAFTCLEIPVSDLFYGKSKEEIIKKFC